MHFVVGAKSEIGAFRPTNQDSVCVKRAVLDGEQVVMAVVCDGVGGLSHGELASAAVVRALDNWFTFQLPRLLFRRSLEEIGNVWGAKLGEISQRIRRYGEKTGENLGTTCSGVLLAGGQCLTVHVGDTRIYRLRRGVTRLTTDQTYAQRAAEAGRYDGRGRNLLLQCVGVSRTLRPEILMDTCRAGDVFLLCTDGFWHTISEQELEETFLSEAMDSREALEAACGNLIRAAMERGERDNLSVAVIRVSSEG